MAKKKSVKKILKPSTKKKSVKRGRPKKSSSAKPLPSKKASKKVVKKGTKKAVKPSVKKGRKPSSPNRYNAIKSALSDYYENTVGRKIKRFELKIIYNWVKANYGSQPLNYVLMNIDVVLDGFWTEYCNLYPVDIQNHERYFDWFLLKNTLNDEARYHYPTDIIEVDLSLIGEGLFEFYMEDFVSKSDEYYRICKEAGLKLASPPPALYLASANCEVSRRGNVFKYILISDSDSIPAQQEVKTETSTQTTQKSAVSDTKTTSDDTSAQKEEKTSEIKEKEPKKEDLKDTDGKSQETILEIEKEKIKKEYELKQQKLNQLKELLKEGIISFEQYLKAINEV